VLRTACKRLFSSDGYIVNHQRSSLYPENVNILVMDENGP